MKLLPVGASEGSVPTPHFNVMTACAWGGARHNRTEQHVWYEGMNDPFIVPSTPYPYASYSSQVTMRLYFVLAALLGSSECLPKQHPLILPPKGISQPPLGFGTWNLKESPENTTHAVALAIQKGYRQIDCAAAYGNEVAVGKGIQLGLEKAGLRREDIWVTSKLWNDQYAYPFDYHHHYCTSQGEVFDEEGVVTPPPSSNPPSSKLSTTSI